MPDLVQQERLEIEVLERLKSGRFLESLIFTGGTMLRLCYGLDRFSVDLDFWLFKDIAVNTFYNGLNTFLTNYYTLCDAENKFYTMLFEIRSKDYPRNLKIEIRKNRKKVQTELAIAYSKHSNTQVLVRTPSLQEVMRSKIEALDRGEIRDIFDIEFLLRRGVELKADKKELQKLLERINSLSKMDYSVKLGSILEPKVRKYYLKENFKILVLKIKGLIESSA